MSERVAIVAGAGGELGRATAEKLAAAGFTVVGVDRSEEGLKELPDGIRRETADSADPPAARAVVDRIAAAVGPPRGPGKPPGPTAPGGPHHHDQTTAPRSSDPARPRRRGDPGRRSALRAPGAGARPFGSPPPRAAPPAPRAAHPVRRGALLPHPRVRPLGCPPWIWG